MYGVSSKFLLMIMQMDGERIILIKVDGSRMIKSLLSSDLNVSPKLKYN